VVAASRLMMEVEAMKSAPTKPAADKLRSAADKTGSAAASTHASDDQQMLYQLRYRPEEAKFTSTARVSASCVSCECVVCVV